jgi:hypothetical protein
MGIAGEPPLWGALPHDLTLEILNNRAQSLWDLAQVASLCTELQRAFRERRTADEAWLAQAAPSAFGVRFVDLLLDFFTQPMDKNREDRWELSFFRWALRVLHDGYRGPWDEHRPQSFDLVGGNAWPNAATLASSFPPTSELETTVPSWYTGGRRRSTWVTCAPPSELETTAPSWYSGRRRRSTRVTESPTRSDTNSVSIFPRRIALKDPNIFDSGANSLEIIHDCGVVLGIFRAESATELVSYLGLFYLTYKRLFCLAYKSLARRWRVPHVREIRADLDAQPLRMEFPTDVQRALDVLRVRNVHVGTAIRFSRLLRQEQVRSQHGPVQALCLAMTCLTFIYMRPPWFPSPLLQFCC